MKYNIVCHDKKTFEVTEEQKEAIYKLSTSDAKGIDVNGNYIMFSNIARIEKQNNYEYKSLPSLTSTIRGFKPSRRKRALENIIKGFKLHFEGREMPAKSKKLLDGFIMKVNSIKD